MKVEISESFMGTVPSDVSVALAFCVMVTSVIHVHVTPSCVTKTGKASYSICGAQCSKVISKQGIRRTRRAKRLVGPYATIAKIVT
jgi:hypothetical protein